MVVGALAGGIAGAWAVFVCRRLLLRLDRWIMVVAGIVLGAAADWRLADVPAAVVVAASLLAGVAPPLAVVDVRVRRLPFVMTVPVGLVGSLALVVAAATRPGTGGSLVRAVVAGLIAGVVFLGLAVATGGLGLGDVVLAAVVAIPLGWLSWAAVWFGLLLGMVAAAVAAVVVWLVTGSGKSRLPLGPFLLAGYLTVIYCG